MLKNQPKPKKLLIIGSGPIVIGQAAEFDYSGIQACLAAREERMETVLVNPDLATTEIDPEIANKVYTEPLSAEFLEKIIALERPDGILATVGRQTGLILGSRLYEMGILQKYGVRFLGTGYEAIRLGEDRGLFKAQMEKIGLSVLPAKSVTSVEEGLEFAQIIGFPIVLKVAFTLDDAGGNTAFDLEDLRTKLALAIQASSAHQVLLEKSVLGWGEFEYEMLRDSLGNKLCVCHMENVDPMGAHTGESMMVAPSQTLSDQDHQKLRTAALQIVEALNIQGGCSVQFVFNRNIGEYYVTKVNPRLSSSSALACKATGYPIVRAHTKIALGLSLPEITNDIIGKTAFLEPVVDYVVVKIPRWTQDKFPETETTIGISNKPAGEVVAVGRTFEEAMYKAIVSLDLKYDIWHQAFLNRIQTNQKNQAQLAQSAEVLRLADKFRLTPELVSFLAQQGVDHYVSEEAQFSADKVCQLLGFEPFVDFLTWLSASHLLLETVVDKQVSIGKTAHGIVYNPQLDKYAVIQPVLYERKYLSAGGFVNNPKNPLGWLKEVYQELGLLPQNLEFIWPLAKILEPGEAANTVHATIFYYAETNCTNLTSSTEGKALWLSLEELQTEWSNHSVNFANTDAFLYAQAKSLLATINPQRLAKAKLLQKQNLSLLGKYLQTQQQPIQSPITSLKAVLLDLEGLVLKLPRLADRLAELKLPEPEKALLWQQLVRLDGDLFIPSERAEVATVANSTLLNMSGELNQENWHKTGSKDSSGHLQFDIKQTEVNQTNSAVSSKDPSLTVTLDSKFPEPIATVWQQFIADVKTALDDSKVYVEPVFRVAKLLQTAGVPLYLTSGELPRSLLRKIANHYLSLRNTTYASKFKVYFKDYLASCRFGQLKTDPEFFVLATEQLRCPPDQILLVDSSWEVIKAAKAAGWQTLHCSDPETLLTQILPWLGIHLSSNTKRLQSIFLALALGLEASQIAHLTQIHPWFIHKLETLYRTKDQFSK